MSKQDKHQIEDNTDRYDFDTPLLLNIQHIIAQELQQLWRDLERAAHTAFSERHNWDKTCVNLEERIKLLTPLVGPTPWTKVGIMLLEFGIYQRIHSDISITVNVDMDKVAEAKAIIDDQIAKRQAQA